MAADNISKFYNAFSAEYDNFASEQEFRDWLGKADASKMNNLYKAFNSVYDNFSNAEDMNAYLGWGKAKVEEKPVETISRSGRGMSVLDGSPFTPQGFSTKFQPKATPSRGDVVPAATTASEPEVAPEAAPQFEMPNPDIMWGGDTLKDFEQFQPDLSGLSEDEKFIREYENRQARAQANRPSSVGIGSGAGNFNNIGSKDDEWLSQNAEAYRDAKGRIANPLRGKTLEEVLTLKGENEKNEAFVEEYERIKKEYDDMHIEDMQRAGKLAYLPDKMLKSADEKKAWLKENQGRYAEAKQATTLISDALEHTPEWHGMVVANDELEATAKASALAIGAPGIGEVSDFDPESMLLEGNQLAEQANWNSVVRLCQLTDKTLKMGSKVDAKAGGVNEQLRQFVEGAVNNADIDTITFGLASAGAFMDARRIGDKSNRIVDEAIKSTGYEGDVNELEKSINAMGEELAPMDAELQTLAKGLEDMEATYKDMERRGASEAELREYYKEYEKKFAEYKEKYDKYASLAEKYNEALGAFKDIRSAIDNALETGLSDSEKAVLEALDRYTYVTGIRAANISNAANAGQAAEQSAEFMLDFILTGGLGKAGTKSATKLTAKWAARRAGKGGMKNIAANISEAMNKLVAKGISPSIGATMLTDMGVAAKRTIVMFPPNLRAYGESLVEFNPDPKIGMKDGLGRYNFNRSYLNAALNTAITQYIEYWSEGFGEYFGAAEKALFKASTLGAPATAIGRTLSQYRGSIGKYLDYGKFNGMFNEMLEEVVGSLFNATAGWMSGDRVGDKEAMSNFFAGDNLSVLFFSFLPMSAISAGTNIAAYSKMKDRYDASVETLSSFLEGGSISQADLDALTADITGSTPVHIKDRIVAITEKAREANGGKLPSDFTQSLLGYVEGSLCMQMEGERWADSAEKAQVASSYATTYFNPVYNPWDADKAEQDARKVAEEAGFTEEELNQDPYRMAQNALAMQAAEPERAEALNTYANAKATRQGLEDGYREETMAQTSEEDDYIRGTLDNNGQVIMATLNGQTVFVTAKDATITPDGRITVEGKDGVVTIQRGDKSQGTVKASQLENASAVNTDVFAIITVNGLANTREAAYQRAASTISVNGMRQAVTDMVGQTVYLSDGQGVYEPIQIVRSTGNGKVVVKGSKNALDAIIVAAQVNIPRGSQVEVDAARIYPMLAQNEDGSLTTDAPTQAAPTQAPIAQQAQARSVPTEEAPAAQEAPVEASPVEGPSMSDLQGSERTIYINGNAYNVEVTRANERTGQVEVMYKDEEGNDIPAPDGMPNVFDYSFFVQALSEPIAEAPVEEPEPEAPVAPVSATFDGKSTNQWVRETTPLLFDEEMSDADRAAFVGAVESELESLRAKREELVQKRETDKPQVTTDLQGNIEARKALRAKYTAQIEALDAEIAERERRLDGIRGVLGEINSRYAPFVPVAAKEQFSAEELAPQTPEEAVAEYIAKNFKSGGQTIDIDDFRRETGYKGEASDFFFLKKGGMTIRQLAERIAAEYPGLFGGAANEADAYASGNEADDSRARNAIIDLFGQVRNKTDINNYVLGHRREQAQAEAERQNADLRHAMEEAVGMPLEQYESQRQRMIQEDINTVLGSLPEGSDVAAAMRNYYTEKFGEAQPEAPAEEAPAEVPVAEAPVEGPAADVEDLPFSKSETVSIEENPNTEAKKARIQEWIDRLGLPITILESLDEVKDPQARKEIVFADMQRARGGNAIVEGWYNPRTHKVEIYLPHLAEDRVDKVVIHEVVSHRGLRELLKTVDKEGNVSYEKFDALMDFVWNDLMSEKDKAKWLAYNSGMQGSPLEWRRAAADEYVAKEFSERLDPNKHPSKWRRFVTRVKQLLKSIGIDIKVSGKDMDNLLLYSLRNYERNRDVETEEAQVEGDEAGGNQYSRVYHGTGADFDRFDHSHMGEGSGSQSYGWGTYVTTNHETGKAYAESVGGRTTPVGSRHLYMVDIPDDNGENYLHWDGYLTREQSNKIMDAVRDILKQRGEYQDETEYELKSALGFGTIGRHVEAGMDYFLGDMKNYATGEDPGAERDAKILNSLGIVGMEIPIDRNGGQRFPGSNYVIFDENNLKIANHLRFSRTPEQKAEDEKVFAAAKDYFGTTRNIREAGYILPDGTMLDFSGRHLLGEGSNGSFLDGRRTTDHREIESLNYEKDGNTPSGLNVSMPDFIRSGAIRIDSNAGAINLATLPTDAQQAVLRRLIEANGGDVWVDFGDGYNSEHYVEYEGARPTKVLNEIVRYFNEGYKPENSLRFSKANANEEIFISNAEKAVEDIKQDKATPQQWLAQLEKNGGLKAGEDKWLGLSDWLKASDRKTLTKQEVLDYIKENKIIIEETDYSEAADKDEARALRLYQEELDELAEQAEEETGSIYVGDHYLWAWNEMLERYGDDFDSAFVYEINPDGKYVLVPQTDWDDNLAGPAQYFIDQRKRSPVKRINPTRRAYTTQGLTNKREIALTVPTIEPWNESDSIHFGDAGEGRAIAWARFGDTDTEGKASEEEVRWYRDGLPYPSEYKSIEKEDGRKWYDESEIWPDYIMERNGKFIPVLDLVEGEETYDSLDAAVEALNEKVVERYKNAPSTRFVLAIDEIQSKRHQEAREAGGYKDDAKLAEATDRIKALMRYYGVHTLAQLEEAVTNAQHYEDIKEYRGLLKAIPAAPFEKNWYELAMKRMLRLAAEEGYDYLAWTTGEQQAARYNIGQVVDKIISHPYEKQSESEVDGFDVDIYGKNSRAPIATLFVTKEGEVSSDEETYNGKQLSEIIGKELSKKILESNDMLSLSGEDLRIGAEGMKGFYDDILPRFMNKYGKKWGVKVEDIELPGLEEGARTMHAVPITEEMRRSVMEGQLMFSKYTPEEGKRVVSAFNRKYSSLVPMFPMSVSGETKEKGKYKNGRIAIFVNKSNSVEQVEDSCFHENVHAFTDAANISEEQHAEVGDALVHGVKAERLEEVLRFREALKGDPEYREYPEEEFAATMIAKLMQSKNAESMLSWMERHAPNAFAIVNDYCNRIGYDATRESAERAARVSSGRGAGVVSGSSEGRAGEAETRYSRVTDVPDGLAGDIVLSRAIDELADSFKGAVKVNQVTREQMPKGHKTDKGYYNTRTGEVYVCIDNIESVDDAIATVMHEAVAHLGLRQLFGDRFPEAMNAIYQAMSPEIRHEVHASMTRNGWDAITATEEYLARLAEKEEFTPKEKIFWDRVKEIFEAILSAITGKANASLTDNELRYILQASYMNLTATPAERRGVQYAAREILLKDKYKVNDYVEPEYLARTPVFANGTDSIKNYEESVEKSWQKAQMEFQDAQQPVRIGISAIQAETGNKPIAEDEDYLTKENLASSIAQTQQVEYLMFQIAPIVEQVGHIIEKISGKKNPSREERAKIYNDIISYLYAKHGAERNRYANALLEKQEAEADKAKYDEKGRHLTEKEREKYAAKDWSGLTSLFGLDKAEHEAAEALADELCEKFEAEVGKDDIDLLWDRIQAATDYNLKHALDSGLLSKDEYDRLHGNKEKGIARMWEHYVPLRGFTEKTAEEEYSYANLTRQQANSVVTKKYKGRTSLASDPIANIVNIGETEIRQGNANLAKIALYRYVMNRPENKLLTATDMWFVKQDDGTWVLAEPQAKYDASDKQVGTESFEDFENRMEALKAKGLARKGRRNLQLDKIMTNPGHQNEHLIRLKVNGQEKGIWVNGNPQLARAIAGSLRKESMEGLRNLTRSLSNLFTTYSLKFALRNFWRDTLYSQMRLLAMSEENGREYWVKYEGNWFKNFGAFTNAPMIRMVSQWNKGTLQKKDNPTETEKMFMDFMRDGGPTGYTVTRSVEQVIKDIHKDLNMFRPDGSWLKVMWENASSSQFAKVLGIYPRAVQALNESFELLTRFTAYQTSRQMGRSGQQAASDAKEISVNFNRKGAQSGKGFFGAVAAYFGATHYFFNAGVQGFQNFMSLYQKHPYKMTAFSTMLAMMGFLTPYINALLAAFGGGDDDDQTLWYWNLPEWTRRSSIVIGTAKGYVAIALGPEQRALYGLGDIIAAYVDGRYANKSAMNIAADVVSQLAGLLPVNPVEDLQGSQNVLDAALRTFMPDPLMAAYDMAVNRDYTGRPLQKENPFSKTSPNCYGAYSSTPDGIVNACQWIAEETAKAGYMVDLPPGYIREVFRQYGGGIYTAFEEAAKFTAGILNEDKPLRTSDFPLTSGVIGSLDDDRKDSFAKNALNEYKSMEQVLTKTMKVLLHDPDITEKGLFEGGLPDDAPKYAARLFESEDYELAKMYYEGENGKYLHAANGKRIRKQADGLKDYRKKWNDLKDEYAKMPKETEEEKKAREKKKEEIEKAWNELVTAENKLVDELLQFEYKHPSVSKKIEDVIKK